MKQMMKQACACFLAVAVLFSAAACGANEVKIAERDMRETYPVTVTDQAGREVALEKKPERIVSSYYISTALLVALGEKENICGLEMREDTRKLYELAAPQLLQLPAVGSEKRINIEETAALAPDLVILPKKLQDSAELLEKQGIPVLIVEAETQEQLEECVKLLGNATGAAMRADELLSYYHEKMEEVQNLTKDQERPVVYLGSGESYLRTCTGRMYQNDLIQMAGGSNASANLTDPYWAEISAEQLLSWNPDYILAVDHATYELEDIMTDPLLAEVKAVKDGKVLRFPSEMDDWDYPAPSSVLGILWLTAQLHPEVYSREQFIEDAADFYKIFFGIEVSEAQLGMQGAG